LLGRSGRLAELSAELDTWWSRATVHLQTEPLCERDPRYELLGPISREPRLDRESARESLGLAPEARVVVVTMGGYCEPLPFLERLGGLPDTTFLVTGIGDAGAPDNVRCFDNDTPLFMPDFLRAADAVVAKLGYGTIAEIWREGLPFAHVTRPDFREMPPLEAFVREHVSGFLMRSEEFASGDWIGRVPELLEMPRRPHRSDGADRAAEVLEGLG